MNYWETQVPCVGTVRRTVPALRTVIFFIAEHFLSRSATPAGRQPSQHREIDIRTRLRPPNAFEQPRCADNCASKSRPRGRREQVSNRTNWVSLLTRALVPA